MDIETIELSTEQEQPEISEEVKERMEFDKAKPYLKKLIGSWDERVQATEKNRLKREVEIDPQELRRRGEILPDETFIPDRTAENNIRREQPAFAAYLTQSRRLALFESMEPDARIQKLEQDFTKGLRYPGWLRSWFKEVDGSQAHGWDSIEVVYDATKPLHVALEHIGHDRLMFAEGTENLEDAPELVRVYKISLTKLKQLVKEFDFNQAEADKILKEKGEQRKDEVITIYKEFFKLEGVVYVCWFCNEHGVDDWLMEPRPLKLGIAEEVEEDVPATDQFGVPVVDPVTGQPVMTKQPVWVDSELTEYPVFILPYKETEQDQIIKHRGRMFYDFPDQEAKTSIKTSYVNGLSRSTRSIICPKTDDDTNTSAKQLETAFLNGSILPRPVDVFNFPVPDASILKGLQYLDVKNQEQSGQISAAVQNRQDSRKTAKEIEVAQQESTMLGTVPLLLFSNHLREVLSFVWKIVQSQALQGKIELCMIPQTQANGEVLYVVDKDLVGRKYNLIAAGDVDVVQRAETEQKMMQDWPVIQTTGASTLFLSDLVRIRYADRGEEYVKAIQEGDQKKQLIQTLAQMMQKLVSPEEIAALPPEQQQQLQQLDLQVKQVLYQP